jgi:hypothetical protein
MIKLKMRIIGQYRAVNIALTHALRCRDGGQSEAVQKKIPANLSGMLSEAGLREVAREFFSESAKGFSLRDADKDRAVVEIKNKKTQGGFPCTKNTLKL